MSVSAALRLPEDTVVQFPAFTTRWRMEVTHERECRRLVFVCLSPNALSAYSIPMLRGCLNEDGTVGRCSTKKPAMKVAGFASFQTPCDLV